MVTRIAALFGLLVLVVGGLAVTGVFDTARPPAPPAQQAAPVAKPAPVVEVTPPATPRIAVTTPTVTPPPVVLAPAPELPVAAAPPVATPPPVVTAPPVEPPPVVAVAPPVAEPEPEPIVTAPPVVIPPPVAAAPPAPEPAPVVSAPRAVTDPVVTPAPPVEPKVAAVAPVEPPQPAPATAPVITETPAAPVETPPAVTGKNDTLPAKQLFAAKQLPSLGKAMAIGYYPRGCLSGGVELAVNGPTWQVMRLSRNRNWGHPSLIRFLEEFAPRAAKATGWKGILVGDLSQPRGGPTPFGHVSHQTGLDVDIWFMPMPDRTLSKEEREKLTAINVVSDDWKQLNPKYWTPQHIAFIKTAAEQPNVERVLVNAVIKQEICRVETKNREGWMSKVRPWYGHHDHIHVRLKCPADSPHCRAQPAVPDDDGCGKEALAHWFSDKVLRKPPKRIGPPPKPAKPPKPMTLADLPPACRDVLAAPEQQASKASAN
ncbi:MAG: penicillin-insensitive murein endopeptidase [Pseudolabrys sp.]|nr:penicillin-insensitive murein endopeptidase [Pseudolabrys sp.]